MDLIIKRSKWLRGEEDSYLVRKVDKKMCCLGFLGQVCGMSLKSMSDILTPKGLTVSKFPKSICDSFDTSLCEKLMEVNDEAKLTDTQRERKLTSLFKKADIQVSFVD